MLNSRWMANRVGLIDFWYYDEEEFYFSDGNMLLRGANGSGKSVTMQSFIPLLLDGNMRPERLDPFGSRARRMENYLLEEGDEREERTGYLYIEFKRRDSETYLTLGIGLRGRKNKRLDIWYFNITDGRRIGQDIFLYKDVQTRLAYTKQELKNRIGDGGEVFESQNEYMQMVNRFVFGYDSIEEYKELVELLIQLRTPKLSKDFKPSIISEILSESLTPLSDEDLRPMSEAIENMDNVKDNLEQLVESHNAAKRIFASYDRYNQAILLLKANAFVNVVAEKDKLTRQGQQLAQLILDEEEKFSTLAGELQTLKQEEVTLKEEQKTLASSDAQSLKEDEENTKTQLQELNDSLDNKNKALETQKEKWIELAEKEKRTAEKSQLYQSEMAENLTEMGALIRRVEFDEYAFLVEELKVADGDSYSFEAHKTVLKRLRENVGESLELLQREELQRKIYNQELEKLEKERKRRDQGERESLQYENQLQEIISEQVERIYAWRGRNSILQIPDEEMWAINTLVNDYSYQKDYQDIKAKIEPFFQETQQGLNNLLFAVNYRKDQTNALLAEKQGELAAWRNQVDPTPPIYQAVEQNRLALTGAGIDYHEFYKCIDFAEHLSEEEKGNIEEALGEMGLLNALIVSESDREAILSLDKGLCDKYIFSDATRFKNNIGQILEVDNKEGNIIFFQQVSRALSSIAFVKSGDSFAKENEEEHHTFIGKDGTYRIGSLSGTITREYQAKYIGVHARERFREEKIQAIQQEINEINLQLKVIYQELEDVTARLSDLRREYEVFPSGDDLRIAATQYEEKQDVLKRMIEALNRQSKQFEEVEKELRVLVTKVKTACDRINIPGKLAVVQEIDEDLSQYHEHLTSLQIKYQSYCDALHNIADIREQMANVDEFQGSIRVDVRELEKALAASKMKLNSIQEQLKLTNYEEIRERLDFIVARLNQIPAIHEKKLLAHHDAGNTIKESQEKQIQLVQNLELLRQKYQIIERGFVEEYKLAYVKEEEEVKSNIEYAKILQQELVDASTRSLESLTNELLDRFHENKPLLSEFAIRIEPLFSELDVDAEQVGELPIRFERQDLSATYRGNRMKFNQLLSELREQIEEQELTLSDQDRELFEEILSNIISTKIRGKIANSKAWVESMSDLLKSMSTSSGLRLSLEWKSKKTADSKQLNTSKLVELLQKDVGLMKREEYDKITTHFRSKIQEARQELQEANITKSFHTLIREVLDYRKWFEFQLEAQKTNEQKRELTDRVFFSFSGGEKAMAMYAPLFSAVVSKYQGGAGDAPRLISLDEAFAGVDARNIRDMFRLMVECEFDFMINSQILWGDYDTLPNLAIYQLERPDNAKCVGVLRYHWNGVSRNLVVDDE